MWGVFLIKNFLGVYNKYCIVFEMEEGLKDFWFVEIDYFIILKVDGKKFFKIYSFSLRNYKISMFIKYILWINFLM